VRAFTDYSQMKLEQPEELSWSGNAAPPYPTILSSMHKQDSDDSSSCAGSDVSDACSDVADDVSATAAATTGSTGVCCAAAAAALVNVQREALQTQSRSQASYDSSCKTSCGSSTACDSTSADAVLADVATDVALCSNIREMMFGAGSPVVQAVMQ
jgi:hypothetical protein